MARKGQKTKQDYDNLAKSRGFEWVGGILPRNTRTKTKWKCQENHEWDAIYSKIQLGTGCPKCFRLSLLGHEAFSTKEVEDYHNLAKKYGFQWIDDTLPKNVRIPTQWRCSEGHEWTVRYSDIQQGSGCPKCAGVAPKTDKEYHDLAKNRGFQWVGEVLPSNIQTPTKWKCPKGDEWDASYNTIQQEHGCPHCAGLAPKTDKDYYDLARDRGFQWVDEVLPSNIQTLTTWRCPEGHEWEARYASIQQGSGCLECFRFSLFGHEAFSAKEEVDYHDLAKKCGLQWIGEVLPRNVQISTRWKCHKEHEWNTRYADIQQGSGCPICAGLAPKTDKDYHDLARDRGFQWVGEVLPSNIQTPTTWKCPEGDEWESCYANIQRGTGCPECLAQRRRSKKTLANA